MEEIYFAIFEIFNSLKKRLFPAGIQIFVFEIQNNHIEGFLSQMIILSKFLSATTEDH